jgi:tRNA pseudouridine38-40 synthase
VYRYAISNRPHRSPLKRLTHWELFRPLYVEAMAEAAKFFLGRHDFSAFRAADCDAAHAVREVRRFDVKGNAGGDILLEVEGTAFLKHMVRNLVGTLVDVGAGKHPVGWVQTVLNSKDRKQAGPTAPAHGLTLVRVLYPGDAPA